MSERSVCLSLVAAFSVALGGCGSSSAPTDRAGSTLAAADGHHAPAENPPGFAGTAADPSPPLTPEQVHAKQLDDLHQLDVKFLSEPVDPAWASASQAAIADVLSERHLAEQGSPAPVAQQATCRSASCRIEVTYASDMESEMGRAFLIGDLASRLPRATTMEFTQPDGKVQYVIFAHEAPASTPHSSAAPTAR